MTDRDILLELRNSESSAERKQQLTEQLWSQYEMLVHKNWAILRRQLGSSPLILDQKEDYYSEAFVAFTKALEAINVEKIRDDNWKFLGYYRWYLKNVRTAFVSKTLRVYKNEVPLTVKTRGGQDSFLILTDIASKEAAITMEGLDPLVQVVQRESEDRCISAVNACMAKWDATRQRIFQLREEGVAKGAIAKALEVHPATVTYYLNSMRQDIEQALAER